MIGRGVVAVVLLIALLVAALRDRLREIAATASTAAEALDDAPVDFLPPEVARLLGALDSVERAGRRPGRRRGADGQVVVERAGVRRRVRPEEPATAR
jgi:hypothetical protein